jgi:hypothetical protein
MIVESKTVQPLPAPTSIIDLKEKLQKKLQELAAKRSTSTLDEKKTPKSRQEILEKRRIKKLERKKNKSSGIKSTKENFNTDQGILPLSLTGKESKNIGMQFSQIDLPTESVSHKNLNPEDLGKKRKGSTDLAGKLQKALVKKQKFEKLKQQEPEKAQEKLEKEKWQKVEALASGEKVKDDVSLLKKSLKRKEILKKKSAQTWSERKKTLDYQLKEKQKKRQENIDQRKKKRPGFEGSLRKNKKK